MRQSHAVLLQFAQDPQAQHLLTSNHQYHHGLMIQDHPKQMTLLLMCRQKVNNSLTLRHNAYFIHLTSSHYLGILSSHITRRRVRTEQQDIF